MSDSVRPKKNFKNMTEAEIYKHKTEQRRVYKQREYIKRRERQRAENIKLVKLREVVENDENENDIRYLDDDNESDSIEISRNNEDDTDDDNDDDLDAVLAYNLQLKNELEIKDRKLQKYRRYVKKLKNKDDNDNRSMRTDKRFNTTEPIFFA